MQKINFIRQPLGGPLLFNLFIHHLSVYGYFRFTHEHILYINHAHKLQNG